MSASPTMPFPSGMQKPVCVFCGSSPGKAPIFVQAAEAVGQAMAHERIPLVYGGGRRGLMGAVSKAALEAGGYSHGIVPSALVARASQSTATTPSMSGAQTPAESNEGTGQDLLDDDYEGRLTTEITGTMHERKMKMAQMSTGGFITLPGGYGTFEEVLEMITWNQLGIHKVPVIILNINNVYTPLRALFETSVKSGFIAPENLSLMRIVDLPGGEADNADESKAGEWGLAVVKALQEWSTADGAGYGLSWTSDNVPEIGRATSPRPISADFSLFTTLRFTSPDSQRPTAEIEKEHVPLVDRHIARLREAHAYFSKRDGSDAWGPWPGDETVWRELKAALEKNEQETTGDWRIRVILHAGPRLEVQVLPAGSGIPGFSLEFPPPPSAARRPLVLDPQTLDLAAERTQVHDMRLYKTSNRKKYDGAAARGGPDRPEVLIHTDKLLLETCTSNIALHLPGEPGQPEWVTPAIRRGDACLLNGVVRRELLDRGLIREADVTMDDWRRCVKEDKDIVGFNGFRGVWRAAVRAEVDT